MSPRLDRATKPATECGCGGRKHKDATRCMACARAHRYPCADPLGLGCTSVVVRKNTACVPCNRRRFNCANPTDHPTEAADGIAHAS
jgi:hypothetical protein